MSHPYDPQCPHCVPAVINAKTGQVLPKDSPAMKAVMRVWNASAFEERRAFIAVTVDSSKAPADLEGASPLMMRIGAVLKAAEAN